jgi:cystathionine beta-lyase/cystathionine gamma-synthase
LFETGIPRNLVRLEIGMEGFVDLKDELQQALGLLLTLTLK